MATGTGSTSPGLPGAGGGSTAGGGKKSGSSKTLLGLAAAGGLIGLALLLNKNQAQASTNNALQATPQLAPVANIPPFTPLMIPNVGGAQHALTPIISGIANVANPYGELPRLYGENLLVYPEVAAQPVNVVEGGVTWFTALFHISYGPCDVTNIQINGKPISSFGADAKYEILPGADPVNEKITLYTQDFKTTTPNLSLSANVAKILTTPQQATRIVAEVALPNGLYSADATGNKTASTVQFNVDYKVHGAAGTNQAATNSPTAGSNVVVDVANTHGATAGQWVTVTSGSVSELAEIASVVNNVSITLTKLSNSYATPTINFGAWQRVTPATGLSTDPTITITGVETTVYKQSVSVDVSKASYDVRITRLTADSTSSTLVNASQWSLLRAYGDTPAVNTVYDKNGNPVGICRLAVKLRADSVLNGNLGQISCLVTSKLATYDGSAWTAPIATANPAWVLADILTGTANKRPLDISSLDGAAFKTWADACTADNRTFQFVFDQPYTVPQAAQMVAATGRAAILFKDGKYLIKQDVKQTTVIQHITPINSWGFGMKMAFPDAVHALRVRFLNKNSNFQQDERIVYADGYSADGSNGTAVATQFQTIQLVGCVDPDQAWKDGRYQWAVSKLRQRTFICYMDVENIACDRMDLVRYNHDVPAIGLGFARISGLVYSSDNTLILGVQMTDAFAMVNGTTYCVRIRQVDGSTFYTALAPEAGTLDTVIFATPIANSGTVPAVGDLVQFGEAALESIECLVQSIEYQPGMTARLTLVDHAPAVYDADQGAIPSFVSGVTTRPVQQTTVDAPVILSIVSDESVLLRAPDGSFESRIQITLATPAADVAYFQTQVKRSDSNTWGVAFPTPASAGVVYAVHVEDGILYDVRIRAINQNNYGSDWTQISSYKVIGKTTPPPDVPRFDLVNDSLAVVYYDSSVGVTVPPDFYAFEWRFGFGDVDNYEQATFVAQTLSNQFDLTLLPKGTITLFCKAVDVAGNKSVNAARLVLNIDPGVANVVVTHSQAPTFSAGTITNGTVVGGVLTASIDPTDPMWAPDPATTPMWSANPGDPIWASNAQQMTYEWDYALTADEAGSNVSFNVTQQSDAFQLLYRPKGPQDPMWSSAPAYTPMWSSDPANTPMWGSDEPFVQFPGVVENMDSKLRTYRAITSASKYNIGKISQLDMVVDVADVSERLNDVVISASGTRLAITKTYKKITNVQLTLEQDPSYPNSFIAIVVDKDNVLGPMIYVLDKTGAQVAGKIDAYVQGY